ncbi:MAG: hypothetical protein ABR923_15120 [Terracidiphilus sp.]|jgi:hypothetical protein
MPLHITDTQSVFTAFFIVIGILLVAGIYIAVRRSRTRGLKNRFGTEYDRAVLEHGSTQKAESRLSDRETRVESLKLRELAATDRERFLTEWQGVQSRFVDYPKAAVLEADDLINSLLEARGYPKANFDQRAADVSVTYPGVMENYRSAHAVAVRTSPREATTEELRSAMIQYRNTFDYLIQVAKPVTVKPAA